MLFKAIWFGILLHRIPAGVVKFFFSGISCKGQHPKIIPKSTIDKLEGSECIPDFLGSHAAMVLSQTWTICYSCRWLFKGTILYKTPPIYCVVFFKTLAGAQKLAPSWLDFWWDWWNQFRFGLINAKVSETLIHQALKVCTKWGGNRCWMGRYICISLFPTQNVKKPSGSRLPHEQFEWLWPTLHVWFLNLVDNYTLTCVQQ